MRVTKIFENIGWSEFADDEIKIVDLWTPSNDYEGTLVYVNGILKGNSCSTLDAMRAAGFDEELIEWLRKKL